MRVCIVYVAKEVVSFWGLGQLMCVMHNRMRTACSLRRNWN